MVRAGRLGPNLLGLGDQVGGLGVTPRAGGASQRATSRGTTESDLLFAKLILSACGVPAEMVEAEPGYPRRDEEGSQRDQRSETGDGLDMMGTESRDSRVCRSALRAAHEAPALGNCYLTMTHDSRRGRAVASRGW